MNGSAQYHNKNNCFDYPSNIEKIRRLFNFDNKALKILDLGCGDGRLAHDLVKRGHDVYGLDSSEKALEIAKDYGIKTILGDLESKLPFTKNQFDMVLLLDTHEHLYDQESILKNIFDILKDDGKLIIAYPNHFDLRNRIEILMGKGIVHWAHRKYENAKAYSYAHVRFLLFEELKNLLEKNNFYTKKVQYNFLAGGIIPTRLTPAWFRKVLLNLLPQILTGKYIILADKEKGSIKEKIYLAKTPEGL
jgi:methionine biosynthesis protein MetW